MSLTSHARYVFNYSGNPSIMDTFGNNVLAFIQRWPLLGVVLYTNCSFGAWVPGPLYSSWPLFRGGC